MNVVKVTLFALLATLVAVGLSTTAYSFHSGGVAECEGCHSMHSPTSARFLLVGGDQSSTCLTCHEGPTLSSYHVSTTGPITQTAMPANMTPGGDFAWLKRTYTDGSYTEPGRTHGHNIVAADFGYVADDNNTTAPGGTMLSSQLACNSCHDPHGKYRRLSTGAIARTGAAIKASGSYDNVTANEPLSTTEAVGAYRLLAGNGYSNLASGVIGYTGVPAAKAPGTYNRSEATTPTRVAYGVSTAPGHTTWSNWCATCHTTMHSTGNNVHPVDRGLGSTIAGLYDQYVKTGDMTGTNANSFSSLVPFATNSGDYSALAALAKNNGSALAGPGSGGQVICLSCHRAHASGMVEMLRFDNGYEFTTVNGEYVAMDNPAVNSTRANVQRRGRNIAEWRRAYQDRPATTFATYQRVLCNKCHAQD